MCRFEIKPMAADTKAFIFDMQLHQAHRGKGIGRKVVGELETRAAEFGAKSIGLLVFGENPAARTLHEKCRYRYADMQMIEHIA